MPLTSWSRGSRLANSQIEVVIDPDSGNLKSLKKKGMETNFLREDNPGAALEVWEDKPPKAPGGEPAWNIYLGADNKLDKAESVKVVETGPIRAVVQVKKSFGDSAFVENIVLYSHADRVDFELSVDWHEKYRFAKVAFPAQSQERLRDLRDSLRRHSTVRLHVERGPRGSPDGASAGVGNRRSHQI